MSCLKKINTLDRQYWGGGSFPVPQGDGKILTDVCIYAYLCVSICIYAYFTHMHIYIYMYLHTQACMPAASRAAAPLLPLVALPPAALPAAALLAAGMSGGPALTVDSRWILMFVLYVVACICAVFIPVDFLRPPIPWTPSKASVEPHKTPRWICGEKQ